MRKHLLSPPIARDNDSQGKCKSILKASLQFGKWLLLCIVPIIVVMIVVRETTTSRTLKALFKSVGNPSRWLMLAATGRLDGRSADQRLENAGRDGEDIEDEAKASRLARSIIHKAKYVL